MPCVILTGYTEFVTDSKHQPLALFLPLQKVAGLQTEHKKI